MKPKMLSVLICFIILTFTALFSNWLLFEIVALVLFLSWPNRGIVWPKQNIPESSVWFGIFWGLFLGILGYPLWQSTGLVHFVPRFIS